MSAFRALRLRLRSYSEDERGFTIVESLIAGLLLVVGALGALQLFDAGTRNTYRAEESQVVNNRLQAELEAIRDLPYSEIGLTQQPAHAGDSNDPRWRVSGTRYALARDGDELRQLVYNGGTDLVGGAVGGGAVDPGPTPFKAGDVEGEIYRFVTWANDPNCPECYGAIKRVVVAAKVDAAPISFERAFQELQTDVIDPEATPDDNPAPPDDETNNATAQFWLTDTPCSSPSRQPITADHAAHNTRGVCSAGPKTGDTRGAPDLMYTEAPALADGQAGHDYATDSEPATGGDEDIGLAMPWASNDSCLLSPVLNTLNVKRLLDGVVSALNLPALPAPLDGVLDITSGDANKHLRIHTWASPPISGTGGVLLGKGTLDLYTKTVNGESHPGEICAWLSVRQSVTIPLLPICVPLVGCTELGSTTIEVDLPMINVGVLSDGTCRTGAGVNLTSFGYAAPAQSWPTQWTKISLPMCFASVNAAGAVVPAVLPPNSRIILSLMVKRGGTEPGQGLEFMYDAVGYESRLELETNKLLAF